MGRLRAVLSLAFLLTATRALAENTLIERYEAPESCPTALWFEGELMRRAPSPANWEGAVRVQVEARGSGFVGQVQRAGPNSELASREVEHESCEQVVRALALIASLLLSPNALGPRSATPASSGDGRAREPRAPRKVAATPPARRASNTRSESSAQGWRLRHGAALGLEVQSSVAPGLRMGPRIGYRLVLAHARSESELGLSFTRIQSGTLSTDVGNAELVYSAGRLELCHAWLLTAALWLAPCGVLDVGELRGQGWASGKDSVTRSGPWFSPGVLGKLELRPRRPLFVEVAVGGFFPLSQPEFLFAVQGASRGEREIYKTPETLGFTGNVSLGVRFP